METQKIYEENIKFTKIYIKNEIINGLKILGKTSLAFTDIIILKEKIEEDLIKGYIDKSLILKLIENEFIEMFYQIKFK
jgi:hypothetical protein